MISIYWLIGFAVLLIIEGATMALTTIWFAGGALVAFVLSLFHTSIEIQLVGFVIVSFLLLFFTRPFALHFQSGHITKTNADSLIGREAKVTEEINNQQGNGTVVINGMEWTARSLEEKECYPADTIVVVQKIQGVKLIVSKKKEES